MGRCRKRSPSDKELRVVIKILSEVKQRCIRIRPKMSMNQKGGKRLCKLTTVKRKHYTKKATDPKKNVLCTICMDSKAPLKKVWTTCCKKTFHSRCLLKWCQMSGEDPVCPLCRAAVPKVKLTLKVRNDQGVPETTEVLGYVTNDLAPARTKHNRRIDGIKLDLVQVLKRKKEEEEEEE